MTVTDVFLCKLDAVLSNLDVCVGIADDMIIWSKQPDGSYHENILQNSWTLHENII